MRSFVTLLCAGLIVSFAVAAEGTEKVKEGDKAPNVKLPATSIGTALPDRKDARELSLADLRGKKNVVLFFFPKAMTTGCTMQCRGFRDLQKEFAKANTVTLGISTDNLDAQKKFTERDELNFPLFADADKEIAKAYGVLRDKGGIANRVTFVIDKKGVVRKIYNVKSAKDNPAEVLEYVQKNLADK